MARRSFYHPRFVALVDMDGVVADLDLQILRRAKTEGMHLDINSTDEATDYYLTKHCTRPQDVPIMRRWLEEDGFFRDLPLVDGAQEGVESLLAMDWDVQFCSKPLEASSTCRGDKQAWAAEHFPDMPPPILMPNKSYAVGDILIDDCIYMDQVRVATWRPVRFRASWHQHDNRYDGHGITAFSWGDDPELLWTPGEARRYAK